MSILRDFTKSITQIPGWTDSLVSQAEVTTPARAYALVPVIRRAVRLRADAVAGTPYIVENASGEVSDLWNIGALLWDIEASLLIAGAAYILIIRDRRGRVIGLQRINPQSVTVEYRDGATYFQQAAIGSTVWVNSAERHDMLYIREYDPSQDVYPGVSATATALEDAAVSHYASAMLAQYYRYGAQPALIAFVEGATPADKRELRSRLSRSVSGIRNAFRTLVLSRKIVLDKITPPLKELVIPEIDSTALAHISTAYGIPETMLYESAANRATAESHRLTFWQDTIRPRLMELERSLNDQLYNPNGLALHFQPEQLSVFQRDETERSGALLTLCNAGVPLQLAMEILGYDLTDMQWSQLAQAIPDDVIDAAGDSEQDKRAALSAELRRWRVFAERRVRDGRKLREFRSDIIPAVLHAAISGALETAKTTDDVRRVFAVMEDYP